MRPFSTFMPNKLGSAPGLGIKALRAGAIVFTLGVLSSCASAPPRRPPPPPPPVLAESPGTWPRPEVLELAMNAYRCGEFEGQFKRQVLAVIDYALPSSEPRLWVIDLERQRVLYHEL